MRELKCPKCGNVFSVEDIEGKRNGLRHSACYFRNETFGLTRRLFASIFVNLANTFVQPCSKIYAHGASKFHAVVKLDRMDKVLAGKITNFVH